MESERPIGSSRQHAGRLEDAYRAHASDAARLAFVLTGDKGAAEDITQDAFVRLGGKVLGLRDLDHARAYLLRTVINLCRGRARRASIERVALSRIRPPQPDRLPDFAMQDEMWRALLGLPQRQRAALFLRYYLDHSEAAAADLLGCSPSGLKSLVFRGLQSLRTSLRGVER